MGNGAAATAGSLILRCLNKIFWPHTETPGRHVFVTVVLLKQKGNWDFTSSWTHRRCDRDGRWSWCADHAHADWKEKKKREPRVKIQLQVLRFCSGQLSDACFYNSELQWSLCKEENTQTLSPDLLPPEVPETTMSPDLLQPLQIFSQLVVQTVSEDLKQDRRHFRTTSVLLMDTILAHAWWSNMTVQVEMPKLFTKLVVSIISVKSQWTIVLKY